MEKITEEQIVAIKERAENLYREGKYFCSEAVLASVLDGFSVEYPEQIVGMASGFPVGVGGNKCICGAVSGGTMAIGYLFGRSQPADKKVFDAMAKSKIIHDKFIERNKVACCKILTKKYELGSPDHMAQCVRFTGEVAEDTARVINESL